MNIQDIYELLERFNHSSVTEVKLEMEGAKISFRKSSGTSIEYEKQRKATEVQETVQEEVQSANITAAEVNVQTLNLKSVKAPLAGTFYHAPSPEAEPFVKKGQKIHKGDVIGIIEAMKLMNEVTALEDGVVQAVVAEDGTLVAYDEVLLTYV